MMRMGRYAIRPAREVSNGAKRRRVASASDGLALLRRMSIDRTSARRLVQRAGGAASGSHDDVLRALAVLLWRGAYVVCERGRSFPIPPVEIPSETETEHESLPPPEGEEGEGLPPAIVPPEYPRFATYVTGGIWAAERACEARLVEQLYDGLAPPPDDAVPHAYRSIATDKRSKIREATHHATLQIERHMHHEGELPSFPNRVPDVHRDMADNKRINVTDTVHKAANSLESLRYGGDIDIAKSEAGLHSSEGVPRELNLNTRNKVSAVRDATSSSANSLDALLYQGFGD